MTKTAAIYTRVSTRRQADEASLDEQLRDCRQLCEQRDYSIVAEYQDVGSGTTHKREGFKALLEAGYQGDYDVIVAWKQDRLVRGIYPATHLGRLLDKNKNLDVELVKEGFNRQTFFIMASVGQIEIDNITERMGMGVKARLRRGEAWEVHRRYDYIFDEEGDLAPDPERADWVRTIYSWYLDRIPTREIRRRLIGAAAPQPDQSNRPRKRKTQWPLSNIHHILTSPDYYRGYIIATREGEKFEIPCPPLIDQDTFERVQELRTQNQSHAESLTKGRFLCQGLVTCADGLNWGVRLNRWRRAGVLRKTPIGNYICHGKDTYPEVYDNPDCPRTIGRKKLDDYVWAQVQTLIDNPEIVQDAIDQELATLEESDTDLNREVERIQNELDNKALEKQWVIAQARKGAITEDEMALQLDSVRFEELTKKKELEEAMILSAQAQGRREVLAFITAKIHELSAKVKDQGLTTFKIPDDEPEPDWQERRDLVLKLVDKVIVHKDADPDVIFKVDIDSELISASNQLRSGTLSFPKTSRIP
jgi:site-specific DNA recombinase